MTHKRSVVLVWADVCDAVRCASSLHNPQAFHDASEVYFVHCNDNVVSATAGVPGDARQLDYRATQRHSV